ncbi:MAG TPA: MurR/RpiR family transcriptional regulator [Firmicutes bacterium]|nr:MurR/RpiR family transcriptional regulator [Bacillota bacterium]
MKRINDAINQHFSDFTKNQRVLSQFILSYCDKAAFMTSAEIAAASGVSQSTVVRFAWALGYKTFTAFHDALQNEVKYRITALEKFELLNSDEVSDASVFEGLAQADTLNIKKTVAVNSVDGLKNVCTRLQFASKIYIYGQGPCSCGAVYLGSYLRTLLGNVCVVNQTGEDPLSAIATIGGNDLLFCISLPRHTEQTLTLLSYAQAQEACIVTVSEGPDSDTAAWADVNLSAECGDYGVGGSIAPLLTLLNTLVCLIVRSDEKAERRLRLVDELSRYQRKGNGK